MKFPQYQSDNASLSNDKDLDKDVAIKSKEKNENFDSSSDSSVEVVDITVNDISEIVVTEDEPLPCLTLRMWVLALVFGTVIPGIDAFFLMRYPSISIGGLVGQLLAFPCGVAWAKVVPKWKVLGIELNPGPFNMKEHACITMFVNIGYSSKLVNTAFAEQIKYFGVNIGIGRGILSNMSAYLISFSWTGFTLPILVAPASLIWPGVLGNCALFKTLHSRENKPADGWTISRFSFFALVFTGSFIWYWFPDLIMPFVSYIGAWISWVRPSSAVLGQVFGVQNGLGMFPLTFDWAQISSIGNPLVTPFWAVACIFGSFVFWIWIILPGLYYSNKWQTAHLPIMTNSIFNKNGTKFLPKKVVDKDWNLDVKKLEKYSPVVLPISFLMHIALGLATFAALWVNFAFRFKTDVYERIKHKDTDTDIHNQLMSKYKYPSVYLYFIPLVIGLALGFAFCEGWNRDTQITSYGFIVAIIIGGALYVPLALVESRANLTVSMDSFFNIISAFWFQGKPMSLLYFYMFGFATLQHAMHMSQSAKIGHYMKVPPKASMFVILLAGIWSACVNPSVTGWVLYNVKDVCTTTAKNNMICRSIQASFNNHLVWGLLGKHIFGSGGRYTFVFYFFIVGAAIALAVHLLRIFLPKNKFLQNLNPILLVGGAAQIPSVTGINYSTWFVTAFIFNFIIHRRKHHWWKKYNLVLATGLDCGLAIAAIIIYFCVVYTGGSDNFSWWGTTVADSSCDAKACPYRPADKITLPAGTIY